MAMFEVVGGIIPKDIEIPPHLRNSDSYPMTSGIIAGGLDFMQQKARATTVPTGLYGGGRLELALGAVQGDTYSHLKLAKAAGITDPCPFDLEHDGNHFRIHMQYSILESHYTASAFIIFIAAESYAKETRDAVFSLITLFRSFVSSQFPKTEHADCYAINETKSGTDTLHRSYCW